MHFCGDSDTTEPIFRTEKPVAKDKPGSRMAPTDVSTSTNSLLTSNHVQGNLLREHKRKFASLPDDIQVIQTCTDAEFCRPEPTVDISNWTTHKWIEQLMRGSKEQRFQYCLDAARNLLYLRATQGHSGIPKTDPSWQDHVVIPNGFTEFIFHVGSSHDLHSTIQSGLIAEGKDAKQGRQTVFFTAVDPADEHLEWQENYGVTIPRIVPHKNC